MTNDTDNSIVGNIAMSQHKLNWKGCEVHAMVLVKKSNGRHHDQAKQEFPLHES